MQKSNRLRKNTIISYSKLPLLANQVATAMRRDLVELSEYAITEAKIDEMIALADSFQEIPNDTFFRFDWSFAVENKKKLRNEISDIIRSLSLRAKIVFGANTSKFRSFQIDYISKNSDIELLNNARQLHSVATENILLLESEGVTPAYLDSFLAKITDFEKAIDEADNRKKTRDFSTEHRTLVANQLYSLIRKYCNYGKIIFKNISPAKYNDYLVFRTGKKKEKENVEGNNSGNNEI